MYFVSLCVWRRVMTCSQCHVLFSLHKYYCPVNKQPQFTWPGKHAKRQKKTSCTFKYQHAPRKSAAHAQKGRMTPRSSFIVWPCSQPRFFCLFLIFIFLYNFFQLPLRKWCQFIHIDHRIYRTLLRFSRPFIWLLSTTFYRPRCSQR